MLSLSCKSFISREKVDLSNLERLCHSVKLENWDKKNGFIVDKKPRNWQQPEETKEDTNEQDVEFKRYFTKAMRDYAACVNNGWVEVTYKKEEYGRFTNYVNDNNFSYSNMYNEVRTLLCHKYYIDVDFVNCHQVLFENLCVINNLQCEKLIYYNDNRQNIIKDIIDNNPQAIDPETNKLITYDKLKRIGSRVLYGSGLQQIKKDFNILNNLEKIDELINETRTNTMHIVNNQENKDIKKYVIDKKNSQNKDYHNGTILSYILGELESKCLLMLHNYAIEDGYSTGAHIHDGLHIENNEKKPLTQEILDKWSDKITKELYSGFADKTDKLRDLKLVIKPFKLDETYLELTKEYKMYYMNKKTLEHQERIAKVKKPVMFVKIPTAEDKDIIMYDKKNLTELYEDFGELYKNKKFIENWFNDHYKQTFDSVTFHPSKLSDSRILNTFTGFDIDNYSKNTLNKEERKKLIAPILRLIWGLSGKKEQNYRFLKNWLSCIISRPWAKPRTAVVLKGTKQGQGKNQLYLILKAIFGKQYVTTESNLENIFGKFALARYNKLLIALDEVDIAKGDYANTLKTAITEPTWTLEDKNKSKIPDYPSYESYLIYSNKHNPIQKESKDRRYFVIDVDCIDWDDFGDNCNLSKEEFFTKIADIRGNDEKNTLPDYNTLRAFYDYIRDYYVSHEVEKFNFTKYVTDNNDDGDDIKQIDYMSNFIKYLTIYCIKKVKNKSGTTKISNTDLSKMYNNYIKLELNKECAPLSPRKLTALLKKDYSNYIEMEKSGDRYKIIDFTKLADYFELTKQQCKDYEFEDQLENIFIYIDLYR